jgi:16S rRNA processing protein RimM
MTSGSCGHGTPQPLLEVGWIARSHGLKGEVVVSLITNRTERLDPGTELTWHRSGAPSPAERPGTAGGSDSRDWRTLVVRCCRPFTGRYLVEFEGVATREEADALHGGQLMAPAVEDPDALFVHDLVGAELVEADGTRRGKVVAVQANPASDLLVTDDGTLVPLRFVVRQEQGQLVVDVPAGLFE